MMPKTWSVVTLTQNTRADFVRFVSWYRALGATEIVIYFHDPEDPNLALVQDAPDVRAMPLTDDLLAEMGLERQDHGGLQENIGSHAYPSLDTDWVARLDVDELLLPAPGKTVAGIIDEFAEDAVTCVISPAEVLPGRDPQGRIRVRTEMEPEVLAQVYGDVARYLTRRRGLIGHRMGKSLSRCGLDGFEVRTHSARYIDRRPLPGRPRISRTHGIDLLHFNASSFDAWRRMLGARMFNASFDPDLTAHLRALATQGEAALDELRHLYERINVFDDDRFAQLVGLGSGRALDLAGVVQPDIMDLIAAE